MKKVLLKPFYTLCFCSCFGAELQKKSVLTRGYADLQADQLELIYFSLQSRRNWPI